MIRQVIGILLFATPVLAQVDLPSPMSCTIMGFRVNDGPLVPNFADTGTVTLIHDGDRLFQDPVTGFPSPLTMIAATWSDALIRAAHDESFQVAMIPNGRPDEGAYIVIAFNLRASAAEDAGQNSIIYHCNETVGPAS